MTTPLGNAIQFLQDFGFFNVVLPFLLVFTIVFGILEKTKIFGLENKKPKKNLNSMVAFAVAFFVVAASNVVQAIQIALPWVSLVLIILVCFLLLSGMLFAEEKDKDFALWDKMGGLSKWFIGIMIIAIIAIFLYAFNLLGPLLALVGGSVGSTTGSSLIFLLLVVAAVWYVIGKGESKKKDD